MTVRSMEEESDDKRGFKVQDRRRFSAEGEAKEGAEAATEAGEKLEIKSRPAASGPEPASEPQPAPGQRPASGAAGQAPLEMTFAAFLWSLSEQALAALGEIPDPASGKVTRDLLLAQQMIDIIVMLRDKTRGNLDPHEQALLKEILSSLQMKYVELARQPGR
jgi:hypothetical protein